MVDPLMCALPGIQVVSIQCHTTRFLKGSLMALVMLLAYGPPSVHLVSAVFDSSSNCRTQVPSTSYNRYVENIGCVWPGAQYT